MKYVLLIGDLLLAVVCFAVAVRSFHSPDYLMPKWTVAKIEARMRRPSDYLNLRRAAYSVLGTSFLFEGVGDFFGPGDLRLIFRIIGWALLTVGAVVSIYSNRTYLDRWTPPRKNPPSGSV